MSTQAEVELFLSEQRLAEARQRQQDEQHADDLRKFASIRDELRELRSEHHKREGLIKRHNEQTGRLQGKLNAALLQIDEHWRHRPDVCNYLPSDPDSIAWTSQHTKLEDERDKLIALRNSLPQPDMLEYARLCDAIIRLEFAESNWKSKLDGSLGRVERGTMNYVS